MNQHAAAAAAMRRRGLQLVLLAGLLLGPCQAGRRPGVGGRKPKKTHGSVRPGLLSCCGGPGVTLVRLHVLRQVESGGGA